MPEKAIPIDWLREYALNNGWEIKEIIDYMIDKYMSEIGKGK